MPGAPLMTRSQFCRLAWLLLVALLVNSIPGASAAAAPPVAAGALSRLTTPDSARTESTQTVPTAPAPALALEIGVAPDPVPVGDTATISVTVTNRSSYPAEDVTVTAPVPDGAL